MYESIRDAPNIRPPKFFARKWPESAFSVFVRNTFITETIRPKCCDDANRNRDLHVLVWSNMSAVWTYFSISEKDPRTAICKTCNAEISRGGASAKTFSTSGLIHHLKSKHFDRYAEYERNARGTEKGVDVTYGLWQALFWYTIMLKAYRENIAVSLSSCTCSECTFL